MTDFLLRRSVLAGLGAAPLALAGCATDPGTSGGPVLAEAPAYRVGDRWTYLVDSQFRAVPDVDEVVEIVAVRADGIEARVTTKLSPADVTRTERWSAPGLVLQGALMDNETRRFREPLQRFRFPLAGGDRWNQWVDQVNDTQGTSGRINRFVSVRGLDRVTVPAGTFDAVRMNVVMLLDDETPFRYATECTHIVWYAPAVRGVVREERRARYRERGTGREGPAYLPSQNEILLLTAYAPAG